MRLGIPPAALIGRQGVNGGDYVEYFWRNPGRSKKRVFAAMFPAMIVLYSPFVSLAGGIDFLVPGVSLESVEFRAGSSVLYMITSEACDVVDTTMVGLSVIGDSQNVFLLEIVSSTWPPQAEETVTARLRLAGRVVSAGSVGEVRDCIVGISVKNGAEPFREPSEDEIEDFGIEKLFLPVERNVGRKDLGTEKVNTPAGLFECHGVEYLKSSTRPVELGGVKAERFEEERSTLELSREVPLWGLVTSRVERTVYTRLEPSGSKIRPVPRITVTRAVLMEFRRN